MSVTFSGSTLADSAADGFDGSEDLRMSHQPAVQNQPVIDSAAPFFKHRGNVVYTVSFRSRKRHATPEAAKTFVGTHTEALKGPGSFSGFGLSLENAVCVPDIQQRGVMTLHSYTITGAHNPGPIT